MQFSIENFLSRHNLRPVVSISNNDIIELSQKQFDDLRAQTTAQTRLQPGQRTRGHTHDQPSYYLVNKLALQLYGLVIGLPEHALVVVAPEVEHPWVAQNEPGEVCDIPCAFTHEAHDVIE